MTLDEYKAKIQQLIAVKSDEVVMNGSADHAAVIVESMFSGAENSMRILTRQFDPSVYAADDLVDKAMRFAAKPETSTKILIEEAGNERLRNHPFVKRALGNENIEFRHIPDHISKVVEVNFSVMDERGYRFEEDKLLPVAIACFANTANSRTLINFFDNVWKLSTEINIEEVLA